MPILPYGSPVQSNQQMSVFAVSNTIAGETTSMTVNASNHSFAGAGVASVGMTNGSVVISVPSGDGGVDLAAGTQTGTSGTVVFSNSNNITFGMSNSSIVTASYSQSNDNMSLYAVSNTTSGSSATANVSNLSFGGYGEISVGAANGSVLISAPSNTTLSRWAEPDDNFTSVGQTGLGSLSVQRLWIPFNITASAAMMAISISGITGTTSTTAGSVNNSLWMGVYTLNGSNLSLASTGTAQYNFTWGLSSQTTANTSVSGMRALTVPMNMNITPGEYWAAAVISQATTQTAVSMSVYGGSLIANAANAAAPAPIGSNITVGRPVYHMQGIYSHTTSVGPSSIGTSDLNFTAASNVQRANFYVQFYNASY